MSSGQELQRVHDVTANYFFWQGLRWVPMGVALLLTSLLYGHVVPVPESLIGILSIAGMIVALFLSGVAGRFYQQSFGDVRAMPGAHAKRTSIKWFIVYPAMALSLLIDGAAQPVVFVSGIVWAVGILAYWYSTGRGRQHYLVIAALVAMTTFIPATGFVLPGKAMLNVFLGFVGALYIVAGVLDHLALRRVLSPVNPESNARPV